MINNDLSESIAELKSGYESLNSKLPKIQRGTAIVSAKSKLNSVGKVIFPNPYNSAPTVLVSLNHSWVDTCQVSVYDVTKTSCTVAVYNGSVVTISLNISWLAIGD